MSGRWHFWIDRGGTFTDVVARAPDGSVQTAKLLSDNPAQYEDAALEAMRRLSGVSDGPLPLADIRIGTTIATNALLERKGEPVLLAITEGFGDLPAIGTQERPDIFALNIRKPEPLATQVLEVRERIGADGTVYQALDREAALADLKAARVRGLRAVAIALIHGWRFTQHEEALAELAAEAGFEEIAVSHRTSPLARLVGRADTTTVDAYLSPVLQAYTARLAAGLGAGQEPLFMQSNGGLAARSAFRGKDAILSGPAGGIVGMAQTSQRAGFDRVIGFDMGGTSTDVSLFAGKYERDSENRVAGVRIRAPMMRIHTVAAGGGSICRFDGARFLVGPESAGAQPGPACYRQGGPLTVTDCNLLLGKLQPGHFPAVFGPDADEPLDRAAAQARMDDVLAQVEAATGRTMSMEEAAEGFLAIAVASMANAIRAVSVAKGHDVAQFALSCFGGAGGQHACLVAEALGIETVLVHPLSGVLSAYGMGLADRRELREATLALPLEGGEETLEAARSRLGKEASDALAAQGVDPASVALETRLHLRREGSDSTIDVEFDIVERMKAAFSALYRAQFGYDDTGVLIVEAIAVEAVSKAAENGDLRVENGMLSAAAGETVDCYLKGETHSIPVWQRDALAPGQQLAGPALIIDPVATIIVEPGWQARLDGQGMLALTRAAEARKSAISAQMDPVRLEIFGGLFMAIAEEMGAALQHSARSVNIRERLDFSCAIFDAAGNLVANAPHMPVHLGSMGESVRAVVSAHGMDMRPGDAFALNAPYAGGTHLPDITVVTPVWLEGQDHPEWFTAARGHHADIGGIAPGSMPSNSRSIEEEGVVLDAVLVRRDGQFLEGQLRELLTSGPYPARNVDQNIADLAAQLAACNRGAARLLELAEDYSAEVVSAYMEHLQAYSAQAVSRLLAEGKDGRHSVLSDNGAVVQAAVRFDPAAGRAVIDFAGTSAQLPDNFNAPESVVRAACLYVIRTLIDTDIPMNDGFLRTVEIRIPAGSMLSPRHPAAVVAGNVETSQLVTDALFGAFGALAASQGTMNNFTFGNDTHQYYETIAGGAGAGRGFAGADAVQTHMTNSRLTDPEILEARFPVLVERFAIRRGSGGAGRWQGGDGVERRIRFLAPMRAEILSNRRKIAPFGLAGGGDGATGHNRVERADGSVEGLSATASVEMEAGDVFVIETPGGGGFGGA
ncbi:MAG: hydantoinase B/oxoprolinase family protein [Sphingomonadaceae bacterium]|nr:hydantoinase B/oxoprolinase family protein [Sphingomonadaceae bacterium]